MTKTRLSSKGQIVLPKHLREALGWKAGIELLVEEARDGILLRPVRPTKPTTLDEVVGSAGYRGPRLSLADMEAAIAKGAARRRA